MEDDHLHQARRATLDLAAAMQQLTEAFEGLRNQPDARLPMVVERLEVVRARLQSVEAAAVTLRNIADFRERKPDHPGVP